jgi:predicted nucleic acid-binding protein
VKYWDSSALVPLCLDEAYSARMIGLYRADPVVVTWWGSEIECASAFARLEREGALTPAVMSEALDRLKGLRGAWHEVQPSQLLRDTAVRLIRVHPLRAADAVQLSSAVIASDREPVTLGLITLDARLASAARREGFTVLGAEPG